MTHWQRVNRRRKCEVCNHDSFCTYADGIVKCMRVKSNRQITQRDGSVAYLHAAGNGAPIQDRQREPEVRPMPSAEIEAMVVHIRVARSFRPLATLAIALGVSIDSLIALQIGWLEQRRAWAFPMRSSPSEAACGIRLRNDAGRKWSVAGGREGLFIPETFDAGREIVIEEGPTNAAALLDAGMNAIGRPSCLGAVKQTVELCAGMLVTIIAQRDKPDRMGYRAGQRGAGILFKALLPVAAEVRVTLPPRGCKDVRDWKPDHDTLVQQLSHARPMSMPAPVEAMMDLQEADGYV